MNAYGTIHAKVVYQGSETKIGYKTWASSRTPSIEEQTALLQDHLAKYQMTLISVEGWQTASDYGLARLHQQGY